MKLPINCFKCDRELEPAMNDLEINQPYAGTKFISQGHYGSTVFDPVSRYRHLEINICDQCMNEFKNRILLAKIIPKFDEVEYVAWDPEQEN